MGMYCKYILEKKLPDGTWDGDPVDTDCPPFCFPSKSSALFSWVSGFFRHPAPLHPRPRGLPEDASPESRRLLEYSYDLCGVDWVSLDEVFSAGTMPEGYDDLWMFENARDAGYDRVVFFYD